MSHDTLRPFPDGARAEIDGSFSMCSKKTSCPRVAPVGSITSVVMSDGVNMIGDDGATIPFAEDQLLALEEFLAWRRQQKNG